MKLFNKILIATLPLASFFYANHALASQIGAGPPCAITPMTIGYVVVYNSGPPTDPINLCASEATLAGIHTYLETGEPQTILGKALAAAGTSSGAVGLVALSNKQESSYRNQKKNNFANEDVRNRAEEYDDTIARSVEKITRPISRRACVASVTSGGGGGGQGGGTGSVGNTAKLAKVIQKDVLTPATENDYVARAVVDPSFAGSCTAEDVKNKVPGCGSVGVTPGLNLSPMALFSNYEGIPSKPFSRTIKDNPEDKIYRAQKSHILLAQPRPGPKIRETVKNKPVAKRFLVLQRRYNSRTMAVVQALSHISGRSIALPAGNAFITNVWNGDVGDKLKDDFKKLYPGVPVPERPSEREIIHLMVLGQFTDKQSADDLVNDPVEIERRRLEVKKLNALLLLQRYENAEWNNILNAHLLSNKIDPVNRNALLAESASIN